MFKIITILRNCTFYEKLSKEEENMTKISKTPIQNSNIVFREESDEWAILFEPNSGEIYGLDPVSIFVWNHLDGKHVIEDVVSKLKRGCKNSVPESVLQDVTDFVNDLASKKLINFI